MRQSFQQRQASEENFVRLLAAAAEVCNPLENAGRPICVTQCSESSSAPNIVCNLGAIGCSLVLVQREMESSRFRMARVPPLRGGSFQGMRKSIESDEEGEDGCGSRPPLIVFDEFPPGYPSARLLSSRAGFCFTRRI